MPLKSDNLLAPRSRTVSIRAQRLDKPAADQSVKSSTAPEAEAAPRFYNPSNSAKIPAVDCPNAEGDLPAKTGSKL